MMVARSAFHSEYGRKSARQAETRFLVFAGWTVVMAVTAPAAIHQ
jgi:hypothetical protein